MKRRVLMAVLLGSAVLTVGCSGSKKETEAPKTTEAQTQATEAPATEAPAATEAAATEAAAEETTEAAETEAAATEAAETEAAATEAAETEAAATEAAETEAAATEAAETEAAATEAAETEAAATEAAETEAAETEAATEEVTEAAETEAATEEATEAAETEAATEEVTEAAETEAATEEATEAAETEAATEEATEAAETEAATEEATEAAETEAATEEATEAAETEAVTEEATEAAETEAATEEVTEAAETEAATEEVTEAAETEAATEEATEAAETEAATEEVTEAAETEEPETEHIPVERPDYVALDHVELGEYIGLPVTVEPIEVSEEEIDGMVEMLLEDSETVTEGTVELGDLANINFVGTKDGVEFEGGSLEDYDLEIGSGAFIPGFEEQLVGMAIGETKDINVTFPEEYPSEDLAGADAVFTVTVNSVRRTPEASDEAVADATNGEYSTLEAYREAKKTELEEQKMDDQEDQIEDDLMNQLYNTCTIKDYPEGLVDYGVDRITTYYTQVAELYFGMSFDEFRDGYLGMDEEAYAAEVETMAKEVLQQEMILMAIAEKEELDISAEEYEAGCEKYAAENDITVEEFKEYYDERDINYSLRLQKARDFVVANAEITVAEPETETELTLVEAETEE